jgi:hypothetical protein
VAVLTRGLLLGDEARGNAAVAALVVSLAVHVALFAGVRRGRALAEDGASKPLPAAADAWVGRSPEATRGRELWDIDVGEPAGVRSPAGPRPPTAAPAAIHEAPPAAAAASPPPAPPRAAEPHRNALPARPSRDEQASGAGPAPSRVDASVPARPAPRRASARASGAGARDATSAGVGESAAAPAGGSSFGAEGEAGVRDLGRAFTRAIPPACDSDPAWATLPAGDAGRIEIAVELSAAGRVAGWQPTSREPPRHLVALARRTVAMLEAGTFSVRAGTVGAGRQVLEVSARTSDVAEVGDEAARAIGLRYTYEAGRGTASFTQVGGRRVDVTVRVVRVEAGAASP